MSWSKRVFDLVLACLLLPLTSPLLVLLPILIRATSRGPALHWSNRVGRDNRIFRMPKFRSMRIDTPELPTHLLPNPERYLTPIGCLLRKTSLDELPQILNVLSGEMSFVGPRPIVRAEAVKYAERFPYYLSAVPGITGLWQVSGRCDVSYEARTLLDETYVCKWSMVRDLWILCRTPRAVVNSNGAY